MDLSGPLASVIQHSLEFLTLARGGGERVLVETQEPGASPLKK